MAPITKSSTAKNLIGQPESVLRPDFILAIETGNLDTQHLPFNGPLQLPSSEAVLKLYFFYRNIAGQRNSFVNKKEVESKVVNQVMRYWEMAGYKDMVMMKQNIKIKIEKQVTKYQTMNKSRTRNSPAEVDKRREYLDNLQKLFKISSPDIIEKLQKSRILGVDDNCSRYSTKEGYTRKMEDISFLMDQRGDRRMVMGEKDTSYEMRVNSNLKKKQKEAENLGSSSSTVDIDVDYNKNVIENDSDEEESVDEDFVYKGRHEKQKETVHVELPKDIMNNPEICAMLDRTSTSHRDALGVVSSILKSGVSEGKQVDLNQFSLSKSSLLRKRNHNRSVLMEQEMVDFSINKPVYAALHWDGKLMKDITGKLQEHEAVLVSGSPHYLEGKILCVCKLVNEDGEPCSTGEAQAEAVLGQIKAWDVEENIVALVFDTTASNTGVHRGATVRLQQALGRPVLFLACRHHMSELVIKACWYSIFEADLSPECQFFSDIKEEWERHKLSQRLKRVSLESAPAKGPVQVRGSL